MDHSVPVRLATALVTLVLCTSHTLLAQDVSAAPSPVVDSFTPADRIWLSVQANLVFQQHPPFDAAYSGSSSLAARQERAGSRVETIYSGARLTRQLEVLFDVESVGGTALSSGRGLGGFTNVDAPTDPLLDASPYVARAMVHYTIPLGTGLTLATRNPLSLASAVPARRLEIRAGKMSPVDFFDLNSNCNDSHSQFTNTAIVNNGAYDYASDARGYTYGIVAEYYDASWALRFGDMLIPYGSDNAHPRWSLTRAHSENVELELHTTRLFDRASVFRLLTFVNHSPMARYRDAVDGYLSGHDPVPDTSRYHRPDVAKVGIGVNAEHAVTASLHSFWRVGWNDGGSEPNPIDRTVEAGIDLHGEHWHRASDEVGAAIAVNGLSAAHRQYLELGGQSTGLGDGHLAYGSERIVETYYNAALFRGLSVTLAYQLVARPGFNRDRGPVSVFGFRIHAEDALQLDRLFGARQPTQQGR